MHEFPVDTPISVDVRMAAGRCAVTAEERDTATVDIQPLKPGDERSAEAVANTTVEFDGDRLMIKTPDTNGVGWLFGRRNVRMSITLRIPQGSSLMVRTASADIECVGRLGAVKGSNGLGLGLNTASGNVRAEYVAGDVSLNAASGDFHIGHVDGDVKCTSASGDLRVDHVGGDLSQNSASGDTTLGTTLGDVKIHSASGDLSIAAARSGKVKVSTASGDVAIGVPAGTGVWMDLNTASGTTSSDLAVGGSAPLSGHDLELRVSTASGDIEVHRVSGA